MTTDHDVKVHDTEFLRHGDRPLLARVYQPAGDGPFPLVVDVHGGAWTRNDRTNNVDTASYLARHGIVTVSLDFRMPPEAPYPASLADINFGIRWLKAHAREFKGTAGKVGALGTSSGGHQVLLAGMRPFESRYAAIKRPETEGFDATLAFVISGWGVLDPLHRYGMAKQQGKTELVASHDEFWRTEAAMAEGRPMGILERGEQGKIPPAFLIQGTEEEWTSSDQVNQLAAAYRKGGGEAEVAFYEGAGHGFIRGNPQSPSSLKALGDIKTFILKHGV